jgi:hypothetical protein
MTPPSGNAINGKCGGKTYRSKQDPGCNRLMGKRKNSQGCDEKYFQNIYGNAVDTLHGNPLKVKKRGIDSPFRSASAQYDGITQAKISRN